MDNFLTELCYSFASSYGNGDGESMKDVMSGSLPDMSGKVHITNLTVLIDKVGGNALQV